MFVLEAAWPETKIVTESRDDLFLQWLMHEAWKMRLLVTLQRGSEAIPIIASPQPEEPDQKLSEDNRPPLLTAFRVAVEVPMNYPPEAAADAARQAANLQRKMARRLGYDVPHRMRQSSLTSKASILRAGEANLEPGAIYDMVDEIYGEQPPAEDQRLRNRVKNQRHRVMKRLRPR